ncbi:MAG: ribosome-associated protein [Spirochaetes bacterium]|nr:MAG: ribosome-associated protein [Spirochaetota bacterium]
MNKALIQESISRNVNFEFSRSGGPGGQNVNKVNTKALAKIALADIEGLNEVELALVRERLTSRINQEGYLQVQAREERTQGANKEIAVTRLVSLVTGAARRDPVRIPTKPGRAARERRMGAKKLRSSVKENRQRSSWD